jgi:adenylosuccinate synthase
MFDTSFAFSPGELTILLDGQAGSSGKGVLGSHLCEFAHNWQFACNAFAPQAGHWVKLDDGRKFFYQTLNSCAYMPDRYEKIYIGPGAIIELPALFREFEENKVPPGKLGISPIAAILQDMDTGFERGTLDFDGKPTAAHDGTMKAGSTAHGVGACRARRVLRRKEARYARDIPELKEFLCDVPGEIIKRLKAGQAGLLEIAQGFQLSYLLPEMFPFCTSKNCTTMAGLDDMMIPVHYAGNVIINFRTFPIRINSNKYLDNGRHMTWDEVQQYDKEGKPYQILKYDSGPGYSDQEETTWNEVTKNSGSQTPIMEITSVTKLPRRVFTFSKQNLKQAVEYNRANGWVFLSVNFVNYLDSAMTGRRGVTNLDSAKDDLITPKVKNWLRENVLDIFKSETLCTGMLIILGTGPLTSDKIHVTI